MCFPLMQLSDGCPDAREHGHSPASPAQHANHCATSLVMSPDILGRLRALRSVDARQLMGCRRQSTFITHVSLRRSAMRRISKGSAKFQSNKFLEVTLGFFFCIAIAAAIFACFIKLAARARKPACSDNARPSAPRVPAGVPVAYFGALQLGPPL